MRARIASIIVCGLIFLSGSSCQQQQQPTPVATEVITAETGAKKSPRKRQKKVVSKSVEMPAAPDAATVAAETAAAARIAPRRPGLRVSRVQTPEMLVALTFDDGPSSAYTPKVLDILNRHGARGTFFVLGSNAKRCSSIVARAAAEGHEIGVHTWSHINMARSSMSKIDSEVSRTSDVICSITGKTPVVMRPPYGATSAGIVNHMYRQYGMRSIMWDVDTQDWRKPGVSTVINRAVNRARPGSIILVHDIHASTLAAIEGIVTGLQARGFRLVTVSQLMASVGVHETAKSPSAAVPGAVEVVPSVAPAVEIPAVVPETPSAETLPAPAPEALPVTSSPGAEMPTPAEETIPAVPSAPVSTTEVGVPAL